MITSIPLPMHRMPQECIHGTQQYCRLGQSGALGDLVAQPGEEAVGPASRSFMASMHEAELLEREAAELRAAAVQKDVEAASKQLVALDSFNIALSGTPAHQLWELIHVWKDAWQVGPHPSVASGAASTSTTPAHTATSTEDEGNADDADVSCPSTPGRDIAMDPSLDAEADLLDQILGFCMTPPRDITGTSTMDAGITSTDDAIVLAPVMSLPGDATLTVDTNVLSGGIADQLVQALVSSGDVVVPPLPAAVVPAAVGTQVAAHCMTPMLVSKMKHTGKYATFLQPKGPAPHPEVDYLLIGLAGKNHHYACSVEGCGMRANSRNTILKHLHTLHWNTRFQCVVGKKMKGDTPDAMGKHFKTCEYHQQNVKTSCKQLFMQHQLELDNHNTEPACIP